MAELFNKQAELYAATRPSYPAELFRFISSKTPKHELAWDVGTGNGQAALSLAGIYEKVIASDTSLEQLARADKHPKIRYQHTAPNMSPTDLTRVVSPHASVDIVTVAQALHWFDLPTFYQQVNLVLRQPGGVLAAWCYTVPSVDDSVDAVFRCVYTNSAPFWAPERQFVDDEYRSLDFPFEPVEGKDHTGPFQFETKKSMDLDAYLTYIHSWSAYQTAREKGVELLGQQEVREFEHAWGQNGRSLKLVRFPIQLRIGRVVN